MGDKTRILENYRVLGWEDVDVRAGHIETMKNSVTAALEGRSVQQDKEPLRPSIPAGGRSVQQDRRP